MGETTSPIHLSMLNQSLQMIASWGVDNLQQYCKTLVQPLISYLQKNDLWVEEDSNRAGHLFGFAIPVHADKQHVIQELQKRKVFVSLRGESIRVSPHIYNDSNDIDALIYALGKSGIGQ
jgi:selenocysteine lyase/cysteine desulfurase